MFLRSLPESIAPRSCADSPGLSFIVDRQVVGHHDLDQHTGAQALGPDVERTAIGVCKVTASPAAMDAGSIMLKGGRVLPVARKSFHVFDPVTALCGPSFA